MRERKRESEKKSESERVRVRCEVVRLLPSLRDRYRRHQQVCKTTSSSGWNNHCSNGDEYDTVKVRMILERQIGWMIKGVNT